jgi:hypothetical protein
MAIEDRIYRRTEAGIKAFESQSSQVPLECRRVLGLIGSETPPAVLRARLRHCSEAQIEDWLVELEKRHLIKSEPIGPDKDLDFTGSFSAAGLRGQSQDS